MQVAAAWALALACASWPLPAVAQFQLPSRSPAEVDSAAAGHSGSRLEARDAALRRDLMFQYAFGTDSEFIYQRDRDLNHRLRDNLLLAAPNVFALLTYRPTKWLEANIEATLKKEFRVNEERFVTLPSGEVVPREGRGTSAVFDQANVVIKNLPGIPVELTLGRRLYEDPRLFLYDLSMDAVHLRLKGRSSSLELSWAREEYWDLDLARQVPRNPIEHWIVYYEYRGIEDHRLAAYGIGVRDWTFVEGRPEIYGLRALGRPSDEFSYWTELGVTRGRNELNRLPIRGHAYDVGATYRFPKLPRAPSITVAYAYGSGDGNERDSVDNEFRQTGLQSNEVRFGGVTQLKRYGEALDPELSNLRIVTVGLGFRPAANTYLELVVHRYGLVQLANELRSSNLTAEMNTVATEPSRRVGSAMDLIIGLRRLFDTRLGVDLRAGVFFPGKAFLRNDGTPRNPLIRDADRSIAVFGILTY